MKKRIFHCDLRKCKKKLEIDESKEGFPYNLGWLYLYSIEVKVKKNKRFIDRDLHFCGKDHLLEFLKQNIEEIK